MVLSWLAELFEEICKQPIYNIEIQRKGRVGDSIIFLYDEAAPNKNGYIGTSKENIQSALIECYRKQIKKSVSIVPQRPHSMHMKQCNCQLNVGMCNCP